MFVTQQQNSAQQQDNMATPEGSGPSLGTIAVSGPLPEAGVSEIFTSPHQGAAMTTEGVNVTVLHIVRSLPAPVAEVEKVLHTTSWDDQRSQASVFFDFLDRTAPAILRINEGNQVHVDLVNMPKTHLVKLLHCVGVVSRPIGSTPTQADKKLLFLHGDGNQKFWPPQPLCLPSSMVDKNKVAVTIEAKLTATITTKGAAYIYPLLEKSNVTNTERTMYMALIPPYFVYYGFENDLDAALILERMMSVFSKTSNMFTYLQYFLRTCLTSQNVGDTKSYVGRNELTAAPSMAAWQWVKDEFPNVFWP